ncbi:hypothetical protein CANCADRAFT_3041 [Tortispora caseinolytica NRRL Y-17796]|uniref:CNH domain-containing protein n=1 Tax=Tortispora caseinolytica NRRL Y-17796 TaxID=767744 RepID=A0A1E4THW4_9ASCO|nr:hypothetical protein CANCADRAFT_3041 [Tortispora caseinolytica NRRL Y-17796]
MEILSSTQIVSLSGPLKIESLAISGSRIFVGSNTGALLVFRETDGTYTQTSSLPLSKKPLKQLSVVRELGFLFVLLDNQISVYDLESLSFLHNLPRSASISFFLTATSIAPDATVSARLVAVTQKGKTLVSYHWSNGDLAPPTEILLPDRARNIAFFTANDSTSFDLASPRLLILTGSKFLLADLAQSALLPESTSGTVSHVLSSSSSFLYAPKSHAVSLPNGVALIVKDTASAYVTREGTPLIDRPQIPWSYAPDIVAYYFPYILSATSSSLQVRNPVTQSLLQDLKISGITTLVSSGKTLLGATTNTLYHFNVADYDSQISHLIDINLLEEAITLLRQFNPAAFPNRNHRLRQIEILRATQLFQQGSYRKALEIFSDVSANPQTVIDLYPAVISGHTANGVVRGRSPTVTSEVSIQSTASHQVKKKSSQSSIVSAKDLLEARRHILDTDKAQFSAAVRALRGFLGDARRKMKQLKLVEVQEIKDPFISLEEYGDLDETAQLVDTVLFKCYILTDSALLESLVRVENACDPNVVRDWLTAKQKYKALVEFYFGKGMHKNALELLQEFGKEGMQQNGTAAHENHNHKEDEKIEDDLKGPQATIQYLQRLSADDIDYIFEYAKWPLSLDLSYAKQIFMSETSDSEVLPRRQVCDFLSQYSTALVVEYLEYIINVFGDMDPETHTRLVVLYIQLLIEDKDNKEVHQKLLDFIMNPDSTQFDITVALELVPPHDANFFDVKIALLFRAGRHRDALKIIVYSMQDVDEALEYCKKVIKSDGPSDIVDILLKMYLDPIETARHKAEVNVEAGLRVLSTYQHSVDSKLALELLPDNVRMSDLEEFLTRSIRTLVSKEAESKILVSLDKSNVLENEYKLLLARDPSVVVTSARLCKVCFKRLGKSVFYLLPDGRTVHYACAEV